MKKRVMMLVAGMLAGQSFVFASEDEHLQLLDEFAQAWTRHDLDGCDLFTFRDGKIAVKNSFRKNRS